MPSRARAFTHGARETLPWNTPASGPENDELEEGPRQQVAGHGAEHAADDRGDRDHREVDGDHLARA